MADRNHKNYKNYIPLGENYYAKLSRYGLEIIKPGNLEAFIPLDGEISGLIEKISGPGDKKTEAKHELRGIIMKQCL